MSKPYIFPPRGRKGQLLISFLIVSLFFLFSGNAFSKELNGEKLFNTHCASCHHPGTKTLIGPGLHGITDKQDTSWIHSWVKNSSAMIDAGDPDAVAIFEEFNEVPMPPQPVDNEQINAILDFIANPPKKAGNKAGAVASASDNGQKVEAQDTPIYILFILAAVLLIFMIILKNVFYTLKRTKQEKFNEDIEDEPSIWGSFMSFIKKNKGTVAILVILCFIWICKVLWDALFGIGVYQDYQPKQPIAFSHKVHAGLEKIPCQYCHSSAHLGKTSGIPTANVCMNCHKYIQTSDFEPQPGEIAKIYDAIGFDPNTGKYIKDYKKKPIKWVKVHNLPDFVYFNHSQHVMVGNIQCQTCHGPVEKMDVMKQYSPLTMGWCIDCHKDSKVQMKDNGYYADIHARLPKKMFKQFMKDGKITVDELGGIECGKCHY